MTRLLVFLFAAATGIAAFLALVFALKLAAFAAILTLVCLAVAAGLAWLSIQRLRSRRAPAAAPPAPLKSE